MPFYMHCPNCRYRFSVRYDALMTTCPNCVNSFAVDHLAEGFSWEGSTPPTEAEQEDPVDFDLAPTSPPTAQAEQLKPMQSEIARASVPIGPDLMPARESASAPPLPHTFSADAADAISPLDQARLWGLAGFGLGVLALLLASLVGVRILTIAFSALGVAAVVLGVRTRANNRETRDRVALAAGGIVSGAVLLLALFLPGLINSRWAMAFSVPARDPNKQVLVPRDQPRHDGRPLAPEEWVDAARDAIRQDDVFIRVESVKIDRLADKGANKYVLVHLRLGNSGHERTITVAGFSTDQQQPVLTDGSGQRHAFVEQRLRKRNTRGPLTFEVAGPAAKELAATHYLDQLLVFEAQAGKVESFNLEVPTAAWGRSGVCRFRCPGSFDARADSKKGKPWQP